MLSPTQIEARKGKLAAQANMRYALHPEKIKARSKARYAALSPTQLEARKAQNRIWRYANKESLKEYNKRYRAVNLEAIKENEKKWRAANVEIRKEKQKKWREANPEIQKEINRKWRLANPRKNKNQKLKREYNISIDEWDAMLLAQGSVCKICKKDNPGWNKGWHTDHCHKTKIVRGILCHQCNVMLGKVENSIAIDIRTWADAAVKYLEGGV